MAHLLHIDASAVPAGSVSRGVAETFKDAWEGTVAYRDLGSRPIPHLTASGISARLTPAQDHDAEQATASFLQDALVRELLEADAYLFAVPMYNFGAPSTFKAWLDQVLIPGRTFGMSPADSPVAGRPATLVLSRGGAYGPGTPREGWDFADPYLRKILTEVFGLDLHVITAELTLAETTPAMAPLREAAAASQAAAHAAAREHARRLSGAALV
ncbi:MULTISPECIES: FMN-dependent NADH-azoreductase [unclassified Nonomuraea]|uniref:FMN-dependent NADH-azoreductase n=1 Tax=Nonomuraea sp. NPDC003804 TaxID=3154547 RepID=UPI0033AD3306